MGIDSFGSVSESLDHGVRVYAMLSRPGIMVVVGSPQPIQKADSVCKDRVIKFIVILRVRLSFSSQNGSSVTDSKRFEREQQVCAYQGFISVLISMTDLFS
jgi:hypothetical protein